MTISARPTGSFADFRRVRILRLFSAAAVLAALAVPATAEGGTVRRVVSGSYDGVWNVLIITQAAIAMPPTAILSGWRPAVSPRRVRPPFPEVSVAAAAWRSESPPAGRSPRAAGGLAVTPARAGGAPGCRLEAAAATGRRREVDHRPANRPARWSDGPLSQLTNGKG